jgi:hypothetical protein
MIRASDFAARDILLTDLFIFSLQKSRNGDTENAGNLVPTLSKVLRRPEQISLDSSGLLIGMLILFPQKSGKDLTEAVHV